MKKLILAVVATAVLGAAPALAGSHQAVTYVDDIKPLMERRCYACHGEYSPTFEMFDADKEKYAAMMVGPRLNSYEQMLIVVSGDEAGALMRRLDDGANTSDGQPGNMYRHLGNDDEERARNLQLFKNWVGHWTLKRAAELTDEDRGKFKVLERRN
jgi:hypothetical protein